MSRFDKEANENPNPAERFFDWNADREYEGRLQYYDKEAKENVVVPMPFTFWILDKVVQITGGIEDHTGRFVGYWSNAVKNLKTQELIVKSKAGVVCRGLYEDIKGKDGIKFMQGLYIGFRDENDEMRLGYLKIKGAALTAWIDFSKDYRDVYQGGFVFVDSTKKKKGSNVYYAPVFEHEADQPQELLDELMAIYKPLKAYLDAYFKAGPALPETNEDGDELTHTGPPQDDDADFYRDNTSGPKAAATAHRIIPVLTPELKVLCNELNKFLHPSEAWTAETMDAHVQSEFDKPLANLNEEEMDVLLTDMGEILKEQRAIAESNEPSEPEPEKPKAKAAAATASVERAKASKISTIRRMVDIKGWDKSEAEFLKAAKVEGKLKSFDELSTKQADDLITAMQA